MTFIQAGIALSFLAMLAWGLGDFFIQRATRKVGDWEALFIITLVGTILLLPFVWKDLIHISSYGWRLWVVLGGSALMFVIGLIDFEALREGKLAVIESIWSFEVLAAAFLAFLVLGETITSFQLLLIMSLVIGLILISFKHERLSRRALWEKGVLLGLAGGLLMGIENFLVGWGSRITDPIFMNFCIEFVIMVLTLVYLWSHGKVRIAFRDFADNKILLLNMSILDKIAWVAYAFATTLAPIAIATALSESYIVIGVILGIWINKERLVAHQKLGLGVAIASAVILAAVSA